MLTQSDELKFLDWRSTLSMAGLLILYLLMSCFEHVHVSYVDFHTENRQLL